MTLTFRTMVTMAMVAGAFFVCSRTSEALTTEEAHLYVEWRCRGSYANPWACKGCVGDAVHTLIGDNVITKAQSHTLTNSFAHDECRVSCIPTSCAIEERSCGTISSLCGDDVLRAADLRRRGAECRNPTAVVQRQPGE